MAGVVFFAFLMSVGLGAVLLALGFQGRRLNDHPICRRCGFDLVGAGLGATRCAECGADLTAMKALRFGERKRSLRLIGAGGVLAGGPLVLLGLMLAASALGKGVDHYMPLRFLLWEAGHTSAAHNAAIAKEISDRFAAKAIDAAGRKAVIATALALQGTPRVPWSPAWGDFVNEARVDGVLADEDDATYRRQALRLSWLHRVRVRAGDPLPIIADASEVRIGTDDEMMAMVSLKRATIDGERVQRGARPIPGLNIRNDLASQLAPLGVVSLFGRMQRLGAVGVELQVPAGLSPGTHVCEIVVRSKADREGRRGALPRDILNFNGPQVAEHTERFEFTVLGPDDTDVRVIPPTPEMTGAIAQLLPRPRVSGTASFVDRIQLGLSFDLSRVPAPLACDVILRDGQETWLLGTLVSGRTSAQGSTDHAGSTLRLVSGILSDFSAGRYDLVLRPQIDAARRTVDMTEMYGGEIVIPGEEIKGMGIPARGGRSGN